MKISIVANTSKNSESFNFIKPILDLEFVDEVKVFGEGELLKNDKVEYKVDTFTNVKIFKLILRLLNLVIHSKSVDYIIGIYEIPHGLFAFLASSILRKKAILCIIGNPAYKVIRHGIRKYITYKMIKKSFISTVTGSNSMSFLIKEGIAKEKLAILPNAIDLEKIKPIKIVKEFDLISLGRLSEEKKIFNYLQIVSKVKLDMPNIRVGIAGSGPQLNILKMEAARLGLKDNVVFLGYVKNKVEFLNKGKLFILTSETEGLPRTILESMACGVPCISSQVGDVEDIIVHDVTGYLIPEWNNTALFSKYIIKLLNDDVTYEYLRKNGLELVNSKYSYTAASNFWSNLLYSKKD